MREVQSLVKRITLVYVRDRAAVFFSILSMLIILMLVWLFLGNMNSENIVDVLSTYGGVRDAVQDKKNADYFVVVWTLAGVLLSNCVTISMTVMGNMIYDEEKNKLACFYVAPVGRIKIALGYVLSAWLIGTVMCALTLVAAQGWLLLSGRETLTAVAMTQLLGMILLNTLVYASLSYLVALFIHSQSAWSGLLTIVGTLVGFLGAVYLPVYMLPDKVASFLKGLPILHGVSMMRRVCAAAAVENTFAGLPAEVSEQFCENMGIVIHMGETEISVELQCIGLVALSVIVLVAAAAVSNRRKLRDR
ncbi:MAG: ABC transporter permease [Lachnospiraceae bacterium]|nr:ABC transporter permease [Lachnospiraceae bacterium]